MHSRYGAHKNSDILAYFLPRLDFLFVRQPGQGGSNFRQYQKASAWHHAYLNVTKITPTRFCLT